MVLLEKEKEGGEAGDSGGGRICTILIAGKHGTANVPLLSGDPCLTSTCITPHSKSGLVLFTSPHSANRPHHRRLVVPRDNLITVHSSRPMFLI